MQKELTAHDFSVRNKSMAWPGTLTLVLVVVLLLAILHLPYPLHEDQALFMYAAREMADDGVRMYREFWDMKQPGIYWWYLAAGWLFSFDAFGLRLMDVCWSVVTATVVWAAVRQRGSLVSVLAPCLAFTSFYARGNQGHFSQVEWLVAGPVAIVLWCLTRDETRADPARIAARYALAGAMVAIIAIFKSMAALMPLAMLALAMVLARTQERAPWKAVFKQRILAALFGFGLVVLPVAAWMHLEGTLGEALWTAFIYPGQAVREYAHSPVLQLFWSFRWFMVGTVALVPWALWAAYCGVRDGRRLELYCTLWAACALVIIGMQVLSYWEYHFGLLYMPVGILAALGFDDALRRFGANGQIKLRRAAVAALVLGVAVSMGWPLARKTVRVIEAMPFTPERQQAFNETLDPRWKPFAASARAVRPLAKDSDRIVVWGDARLHFLTGLRPLVEINGSTFYVARQVEQVVQRIREDVPALVFVAKTRNRMTFHAGGILPRTMRELYEPVYEDATGIWYRPRPGVKAGSAAGATAPKG